MSECAESSVRFLYNYVLSIATSSYMFMRFTKCFERAVTYFTRYKCVLVLRALSLSTPLVDERIWTMEHNSRLKMLI